jgi:SAM-dependent methyltransferase
VDPAEIEKLTDIEDRHWWYCERRAVLGRLLGALPRSGVALDIGAAGGGNTRVLQDHGWRAVAVEASELGPVICQRLGVVVARADATLLPFADRSVDLVVAFDVLEHIEDDKAVVSEIRRVLRPDATFLVAVPADPRLWSAHDVAVDHLRRYTRDTLSTLIAGNGFQIVDMWSWNVLMRPVLMARRRRLEGSDQEQPSGLLNFALTQVIRLERHLPVRDLPGISLMVEARPVQH